MTDRILEATLSIIDQATTPTLQFKDLLDSISDRIIKITVDTTGEQVMNQVTGSAKNVDGAMKNVAKSTSNVGEVATSMGSKLSGAFSSINGTIKDTMGSVSDLAGSLAAMAAGGVIAYSYIGDAQSKLYKEEVYAAVDRNKSVGFTSEQLKEQVAKMTAEAPGWETKGNVTEDLYSAMIMSSKYVGKGTKGLEKTGAISKLLFANQEMLNKEGITDVGSLIQRATKTSGKMEGKYGATFQVATGLSDQEMKTAKSRMDAMVKRGLTVNIKAELDKRPWEEAANNIDDLKKSIGASIGVPMRIITSIVAKFAKVISDIPLASGLIGWSAMLIGLAGTVSMAISVFTPLYELMKSLGIITKLQTVYTWALTTANSASAVITRMLTVNTISDVAIQNASTTARLRMIAASVWQTAVLKAQAVSTWLLSSANVAEGSTAVAAGTATATAWTLAGLPIWAIVTAIGAVITVIGIVLYKMGVLTAVWKALSTIKFGEVFKDIMKGDFAGAWKLISKGAVHIWDDAKSAWNKWISGLTLKGIGEFAINMSMVVMPLLKPMLMIADFIRKLIDSSDLIGNLTQFIYDILKRIVAMWDGFINWAKDLAFSIVNGLRMFLPEMLGGYSAEEKAMSEKERKNLYEHPEEKQKEIAKNVGDYGIAGWGSGEDSDKIGLNRMDIATDIYNRPLYAEVTKAIKDASNGESDSALVGAGYKTFQERYPELVDQLKFGHTGYYTVNEAAKMGVPADALPPKPTGVSSAISNPVATAVGAIQKVTEKVNPVAVKQEKKSMGENDAAGITWDVPSDSYISTKTGRSLSDDRATAMEMALQGLETGTDYVPKTAPYLLHKGEKVTPASQNHGSGPTNINLNIPVSIGKIDSSIDINKFANQIAKIASREIKNQLSQRRG